MENEKSDFWTLTVRCSVCAGDMEKQEVIDSSEKILTDMTDGSDIMSIAVLDATRDEI